MYRRTFSAQWRLQAGELPPSDVVEDIFRGGSGWKSDLAPSVPKNSERRTHRGKDSVETIRQNPTRQSPNSRRPPSGRFHQGRPVTPLSPEDDQSDFDNEDIIMNGNT